MKDSVVRGYVLQFLYQRRLEDPVPFGGAEQAVPPPQGVNRRDWLRALAQLSEYGLIDWAPLEDQSGMGRLAGFAKINDLGVRVLEGAVAAPISVSVDERARTATPVAQDAPIVANTTQQQAIASAVEKVIVEINQSDSPSTVKDEARAFLQALLKSNAGASLTGASGQSLLAKYFTK
ncbi:MAG TPA: hypothetical protein VGH08_00960 [Chthoniobacterales bacterium]